MFLVQLLGICICMHQETSTTDIQLQMTDICIKVLLHLQGQIVNIPFSNGRFGKQTLASKFPGATELKYILHGSWTTVSIENDPFRLPSGDYLFVVITNTVGKCKIS